MCSYSGKIANITSMCMYVWPSTHDGQINTYNLRVHTIHLVGGGVYIGRDREGMHNFVIS